MALRQRIYFFDPLNLDRFKSKDIPTEDTMTDFSDSIPFIKEIADRSMLTRAGIAKTSTDAKVNIGSNDDDPGVSPSGFTTFVRPGQLPVMLDTGSIVWTKTPRGGLDTGDTGIGIEDWSGAVQFPTIVVPEDTSDILTELASTVYGLTGALCAGLATKQTVVPGGDPLTTWMTQVTTSLQEIATQFETLANQVCGSFGVDLGDVVMTVFPTSAWGSSWLEPNGQSLATASYPDLFAIVGYTYGGGGATFNLPDLTTGNRYLRAKQGPPNSFLNASGGSNSVTLLEANIPLHTHTFSGNTASDGAHTHSIPTKDTLGTNNSARPGDAADGSFNLAAGGEHTHTFTGTTDGYGQNPPTGVSIEPEYKSVYLKMKVL